MVSAEYCVFFFFFKQVLQFWVPVTYLYWKLCPLILQIEADEFIFCGHREPTQFHSGAIISGKEGRSALFPLHLMQANGLKAELLGPSGFKFRKDLSSPYYS